MTSPGRIVWGHAILGVGVLIRRLSAPVAVLALAALVLAGAGPSGVALGAAFVLGIPAVLLIGGRILGVMLGALGWIVFPADHRAVLSDIASEPQLQV